jgi:CDP-6-deoxy-D-xylo-4-hexulose-3-dehydrase
MAQPHETAKTSDQLRHEIAVLVEQYDRVAFPDKPFLGGISTIPVSGKVFDADELQHLVDSSRSLRFIPKIRKLS